MKYPLINQKTGEETICEKVVIDGFEYYVCDAVPYPNDAVHSSVTNTIVRFTDPRHFSEGTYKKVIATNNPRLDIPQVVDNVEMLAEKAWGNSLTTKGHRIGFVSGYNKSQSTHPFSEEDMIEFHKWVNQPHPEDNRQPTSVYVKNIDMWWHNHNKYASKELLQLWKSQQPKKVYYEK